MATTLSTWTIDPVLDFIEGRWEEDVLPTLTRYIEIPAKSPAFDPQWAANGHIDRSSHWKVTGDLTIHGVARSVVLAARISVNECRSLSRSWLFVRTDRL